MKLYVGNVGSTFTDVQLQTLFAPLGAVESAKMIRDQDTGNTRGFGFVEYRTLTPGKQCNCSTEKTLKGGRLP
jgi:RNA recognition motif-containing protein